MVPHYGTAAVTEITGEEKDAKTMEPGFFFGSFFVPFSEVMRV